MFWFSTLLAIPVSLIYKDKVGELYNSVKTLLGEENWKGDKRRLTKQCKMNEDTEVRISFAYLFRIEIEGKYFLVQNSRTGKYQPVGGVYKFNEMEHNYLKEHFSFEYDKPIAVDEVTKSDYRLYIKSKDLNAFIKRFDKTPHCQNSCHPHPNNLNGGKGDNHGTIQCRTQTSNTRQTFITHTHQHSTTSPRRTHRRTNPI